MNIITRYHILRRLATKTVIYILFLLGPQIYPNEKKQADEEAGKTYSAPIVGEIEREKSGFEMVFVAGGDYIMGGNDDVNDGGAPELRVADECPHLVTVSNFFIGKYEVTQADWLEIMGTNPSKLKGHDDYPVDQVSWYDVQEFIKVLNLKYSENYRLPTEEEWEFAARGGLNSPNYMYAGSDKVEEVAWFADNSDNKTHSVGMLKPNELGIYDMSGNIWEWCSNVKLPYPCDNIGKRFDSAVCRGGTYANSATSVRVRDRNGRDKQTRLPTLGFRLAK